MYFWVWSGLVYNKILLFQNNKILLFQKNKILLFHGQPLENSQGGPGPWGLGAWVVPPPSSSDN